MRLHPVFDSPEANHIARKATQEATAELNATPRHLLDPSNPNHPDNFTPTLFGYQEAVFLEKQYR